VNYGFPLLRGAGVAFGGAGCVCILAFNMNRKIIPYNPNLKELARQLRNNSTQAEIILWKRLRGKDIYGYDFHRQKPIDNYILDFFCYELMLGIELDGMTHNWEETIEKDRQKERRLNELGITVLRFTNNQVMNDMENVMGVINDFIVRFKDGGGRQVL